MKTLKNKIGHQAPIGSRVNSFNSIEIEGDLAYCKSHNFVYNSEEEEKKLYWAQPCYYTDIRFEDGNNNFYKNTKIHWTRYKEISLKACIRKIRKVKGIPVGTLVDFNKSWYYTKKNVDNSYVFKVKEYKPADVEFEINAPSYSNNFTTCERSRELTNKLREAGFIVNVWNTNPDFIYGEDEGEIAVAYGYGKKIGYSSEANSFRGYGNGSKNVLFDFFGEFDKWSRCHEISKETPIDQIVREIKEAKPEFEEA